jgi:hypothetical protein
LKIVTKFLSKNSSPVTVEMIKKLIGMLAAKEGKDGEEISV